MAYTLGQESLSASPKDNALKEFFGDCCMDSLGLFFLPPSLSLLLSLFLLSFLLLPFCLFIFELVSSCAS